MSAYHVVRSTFMKPISAQQRNQVAWVSGAAGVALLILGGAMYARERKLGRSGGGLGRGARVAQAPILNTYSDGNMRAVLRGAPEMPIEQRVATIQELIEKSIQDPQMRKVALEATRNCPERDGLCEAKAIYDYVKKRVRYTGDIAPIKWADGTVDGVDLYQTARRTLEFGGGDCLPISALVLTDNYELVPLIELEPGHRIMGDGGWATVQDRWLTGEKRLLAFELSNGCVLRCTPEHRIFRNVAGRVEEIRASEARPGDDLVMADKIPVAGEDGHEWPEVARGLTDDERSWLLGTFVADGWADGKQTKEGFAPYRIGISGRDGQLKEAQKREVEALMAKIGVATRWHEKYIAVNDSALACFFAGAGKLARNKHVQSLKQVSEDQVHALIRGLAADADNRNGVFGTTSVKLALQLRVLHRMVGFGTHISRVDNHGGLGTHPVYRVTPRFVAERRDHEFARIRAIADGGVELCMDLTTDTGKFWLPESDVLVHNCDDHTILTSTLLALNGVTPRIRVTKESRRGDWSHIYVGALLPKFGAGKFVAVDTTLPGDASFGVEAPYAKHVDFDA